MAIICLILGLIGWFIIMSATPFDTSVIFLGTLFSIGSLIIGILAILNTNSKKIFAIIGIIFCIISFFIKADLDNTRNSSSSYNYPSQTTVSTNITTPSTSISIPSTITTTKKNYQQIYNEYSQKLIEAGPTSSINEMANILFEGGIKMAEYMYSATGIDGQYATYEEWWMKLWNVYLENCR